MIVREESLELTGGVAKGVAEHCSLFVEGAGPVMGVGVGFCLGEGVGSDCLVESVGDLG